MKKNWLKVLILAILAGAIIWAGKGIFKYNVFSTHDGDHHIARSFDAIQTFAAGEFPLRWAGSLNYLCGVPIYNFYYPLLYYLVVLLEPLFKNVIFTLQVIFFLSLAVGTIGFYFWAKEETGKGLVALAGALVYLFAPYRFVLIFVRGSPEYLAYAILPVVLFLYSKTFNSEGKKFVFYAFLASVMGTVLTISHNFTVMFLIPIILLYLIVKIIILKLNFKKILWITVSFVGVLAMGSFFLGPALLEQKYTGIGSNFIMWREHFPELWQLWNSKWGYFYSSLGTANDGFSFMLGYAQWLILALGTFFVLYQLVKSKFRIGAFIKENVRILIFFLGTLFTLYLILPWSIPVWEKVRPLQEIQFSWRLLGTAIFTIAALFVFVLDKIKSKYLVAALGISISLFAVVAERNHMLPQPVSGQDLYRYADFEKLHPERYMTTTLADEVLPLTAKSACWFSTPAVSTSTDNEKNTIDYKIVHRDNVSADVKFEINPGFKSDKLVLALSYFPGIFKINLNGNPVSSYSDCSGRVCIGTDNLRSGANFVSWKVGENRTEKLFDYVTLGFFVLWLILLFIKFTGIYKNKKTLGIFIASILIFAIFMFYRTYNLNARIGFGWDQERDANAVFNILKGNLTLLGPRVQGPMGFYLPPYFFYILAPFYALGHLSPFSMVGFIVFWSVFFFAISLIIISKIFNRETALFFLALWSVNNLAVSMDTIAWNPIVIPLLVLLLIYMYYLYLTKERPISVFLIGLVFGLGISFHLQFLFLFPFLIPLFIDIFRSKKFIQFIYLTLGIVVPFVPIILFDLRHNFLNLKLALDFSMNSGFSGNRVITVFSHVVSFITGVNSSDFLAWAFYFLIAFGFVLVVRKTKNEIQKKIFKGLGLTWALTVPLFDILIKNPSEYYFNYLLVILFILLAYLLNLRNKIGLIVIAVLLVYFGMNSTTLFKSYDYFLQEKDNAVLFLKKVTQNSSSFNVSFDVPLNEDTGYRYLLQYHGVKYSGDPKDPLIEFVVPPTKKPTSFFLGKIGIYFPATFIKDNWLK